MSASDPVPADVRLERDRALAELANLSVAQELADIREAVAVVASEMTAWTRSPDWRGTHGQESYLRAVTALTAALAALGDDADLTALTAPVCPFLGAWITTPRGPGRDVHRAVEELRHLVMTRSTMAAHARETCGRRDERDRRRPGISLA